MPYYMQTSLKYTVRNLATKSRVNGLRDFGMASDVTVISQATGLVIRHDPAKYFEDLEVVAARRDFFKTLSKKGGKKNSENRRKNHGSPL